jgi:imidazolonepropionase
MSRCIGMFEDFCTVGRSVQEGIDLVVDVAAAPASAAASELNLPVKLHAEQLSNLGGAKMAARHGALSADHLEYLDEEGVRALAAAGTVAVLLPGAYYYLRETQAPPVAALRAHGVPVAVATDLNPGSSPVHSLLGAMNMASVLFGLTPEEALRGVTVNAARALGLADRGRLAPGLRADFVLWEAQGPADLVHPLGLNHCAAVIRKGELVKGANLGDDR